MFTINVLYICVACALITASHVSRLQSLAHSSDFPCSDSASTAQTCKKRKGYVSEYSRVLQRRFTESPSSINNKGVPVVCKFTTPFCHTHDGLTDLMALFGSKGYFLTLPQIG